MHKLKQLEQLAEEHVKRIRWMNKNRMPLAVIEREEDSLAEISAEIALLRLEEPPQELPEPEKPRTPREIAYTSLKRLRDVFKGLPGGNDD
jgi:hypothetical protein